MRENEIILARVSYQRAVESTSFLTEEQRNDLQILSFPKEKIKGDRFKKIFPLGKNIAIAAESRIPIRNRVPTADLVILGPNAFDKFGRDIFSVFDFLNSASEKDFSQLRGNDFFVSPEINDSLLGSESSFINFIEKIRNTFGAKFTAEVLGSFFIYIRNILIHLERF